MTTVAISSLVDYQFDSSGCALVIIDMQNDFCKPEGFFAQSGFDVSPCTRAVKPIRTLLEHIRQLGLEVVWTKSTNADPPTYKLPPRRFRPNEDALVRGVRGSDQFKPGAWGTEITEELRRDRKDLVVEKPRYDAFYRTDLEEKLRRRGIDTLVVVGVTTNCCVDSTVRSAFVRGFHVCVLADCVAAFGQEKDLHDATLRNLSLLFGVVSTAGELVAALRNSL